MLTIITDILIKIKQHDLAACMSEFGTMSTQGLVAKKASNLPSIGNLATLTLCIHPSRLTPHSPLYSLLFPGLSEQYLLVVTKFTVRAVNTVRAGLVMSPHLFSLLTFTPF